MPLQGKRPVQTGPTDPENMTTVVDSIRSLVQLLRVAGRESERELGISSAQLKLLHELQDRPGQSINELADRTFTHQSSVSLLIGKLVESRLVTRGPARDDARKVEISLSSGGRALLRKSPKGREDRLTAALRSMPRGDLKELAKHLETLTSILAESSGRSEQKKRMTLET
jgi:DNA-binding MarR family transcriptional regulator